MLFNAKNGQVSLGDARMSYVRFGRGDRALVVLPGLSDGLATVKGKALLLAGPYRPYLDRFTVYMFSRRDALQEGSTIRGMACDQAEAMRALGLDSASVMGVSQGGMIAQWLAVDCPELVEKLVLAVTAPRVNPTVEDCVNRWISLAQQGKHRQLMIDTAEHTYSARKLAVYRRAYPLLGLVGRPASYDRFLANTRAILAFDATPRQSEIACPTLIIGGADDRIVGPESSPELHARIPGSELYVYDGLGHAVYEEARDFYARVFRFLEA